MKKPGKSDAVAEVKHRHSNPFASLQYARVNKSIIYITMHKQKAPINVLPHSKALKT